MRRRSAAGPLVLEVVPGLDPPGEVVGGQDPVAAAPFAEHRLGGPVRATEGDHEDAEARDGAERAEDDLAGHIDDVHHARRHRVALRRLRGAGWPIVEERALRLLHETLRAGGPARERPGEDHGEGYDRAQPAGGDRHEFALLELW